MLARALDENTTDKALALDRHFPYAPGMDGTYEFSSRLRQPPLRPTDHRRTCADSCRERDDHSFALCLKPLLAFAQLFSQPVSFGQKSPLAHLLTHKENGQVN